MAGPVDVSKRAALLTRAQRRAVEYADGPLIVLAGPGTGKTRVIVERIAHAIRERGVDPASIVAITFTIKAAEEMRRRLAIELGDNRADQVRACTSHSFGRDLVTRFSDVLGFAEPPKLIDGPVVRRTLRELARELGSFPDLVAQGREGALAETVKMIGACRNSNVTTTRARAFAERWGLELEQRHSAGEEPSDDFLADQGRQRRFAEHARLAEAFEKRSHERGWICIDELISLAIRLLRDHPMVAAIVRQECRCVLFDEFQDANLAQIKLLELLCPPSSRPDLCVVGDDDQSIYRFRGADDRGFERFEKIWGKERVERVTLDENHRSRAPIVTLAGVVMSHAPVRYDATKTLRVAESKPEHQSGPPVEVVRVPRTEWARDAELIAASILADQRRAETAKLPPTPLNKIAVIARQNKDAERIFRTLQLEGIRCELLARRSLFDDPGVKDVREWITLLTVPSAAWAVSHVLCRPPIGMGGGEAVALRRAFEESVARQTLDREQARGALDSVRAYVDWLRKQRETLVSVQGPLDRFLGIFDRLWEVAAGVSADRAVFEIIAAIGTPDTELLPARDRAERVRSLAAFMSYVQSRLAMMEIPSDLTALRRYLDDVEEADEGIAPEEQVSGDGGEGSADAEPAVQVLTAHKSKGLEFDTVYVPRVGENGYNTSVRDDGFTLPSDLPETHGVEKISATLLAEAEARRVFYVACTRAERRLLLIAPTPKDLKKSSTAVLSLEIREAMAGPLLGLAIERMPDDLIAEARQAGVDLARAGGLEAVMADLPRRQTRRMLLDQARRSARMIAAAALGEADKPVLDAGQRQAIAATLADAARMLEIASALEKSGESPSWVEQESAAVRLFAQRLGDLVREAPEDANFEDVFIRAPKAPLKLSHTTISEYLRCPRCYYIKYVMGFPEPQTTEIGLGQVAHKALERFYREWREADASGAPTPGKEKLLRIGRECFDRSVMPGIVADRQVLDDLMHILGKVFDTLHESSAHVLDLEKYVEFALEHNGQAHTISAKIDRIDQRASGGYRIIDYKSGGIDPATGEAMKKYATPDQADMQMGIYAMALPHLFGGDQIPPGEAEYWVLAAGVRGRIDFEKLKITKIREKIGEVIDGILAGDFRSDARCGGLCTKLGLGGASEA